MLLQLADMWDQQLCFLGIHLTSQQDRHSCSLHREAYTCKCCDPTCPAVTYSNLSWHLKLLQPLSTQHELTNTALHAAMPCSAVLCC
jgi:hypothetical protein